MTIRLLALTLLLFGLVPAHAARLALVIGNDRYTKFPEKLHLHKAGNDATTMAAELSGAGAAGFEVINAAKTRDLDRAEMLNQVETLTQRIRPGDEVVVFFSGHGVQIGSGVYLLPADFPYSTSEKAVINFGVPLQSLMDDVRAAGARFALFIVDACRENPLRDGSGTKTVGLSRGLRGQQPPVGQMVMYAAGAEQQALDRLSRGDPDPNGVFTRVLVKHMRQPGLPIRDIFENVQEEVENLARTVIDRETGKPHEQRPALYSETRAKDKFCFRVDGRGCGVQVASLSAAPVDIPAAPSGGSLNLKDLKKQEAVRLQWEKWQAGMKAAFAEVEALSGTSETRLLAWDRYLATYAQDNPFSADDDLLRAQAKLKRSEAQGSAEKQKAEATQQQQLAQQAADDVARRQREAEAERGRREEAMAPGKVFTDCTDCPEMVVLPARNFTMGSSAGEAGRSSNEGPQHGVAVQSFALGKTEVTLAQYQSCVDAGKCRPPEWLEAGSQYNIRTGNNDYYKKFGAVLTGMGFPVVGVSWDNAREYVSWLSTKTGKSYRLPSESEWEYACRAGGTQTYCGSESIDSVAWYGGNSGSKTHPAAGKQANAFGLFDMSGNVWEWVEDCYHDSYSGAPNDGSAWTSGCKDGRRVVRGGSWFSNPQVARSANRIGNSREYRSDIYGFRVARMLP
ncbi:MAG: SUMF1/EgtB/PvdO family nonheme iron enzyme [Sulfuritalea sp.]|nr:SUMF1/EgtB/PvdO family nonheme iron enzyme [Sulfuritalea sp.]